MKGLKLSLFIVIILSLSSCKSKMTSSQNSDRVNIKESTVLGESSYQFPKSVDIINDYDAVFTDIEYQELVEFLNYYEEETTRQIIIVTVSDLGPYEDIQQYATDLGNTWHVGTAGKDNGLVIVLSKRLRKVGIATGTGTQKVLTYQICKDVIDHTMIPLFKENKYFNGIDSGIKELMKSWK